MPYGHRLPQGHGRQAALARVEGDKVWGLGNSDDKGGVALVLHTVKLLDEIGFTDCTQLGVLINGDEEFGSPGSGTFNTQLGWRV